MDKDRLQWENQWCLVTSGSMGARHAIMNVKCKHLFLKCSVSSVLCSLAGCASPGPVARGMVLLYTRAQPEIGRAAPEYRRTLQVRWLGTACYLLQLGDTVVFTDPSLTHQPLARVALGGTLKSDASAVSRRMTGLPVPQAIFVGHSHYDHLLDLAACLRQPGCSGVPVYGSSSTRNILCAYGRQFTNAWRPVITNSVWQQVAPGIRYKAFATTHGRQLPLLPLLYPGQVNRCLRSPPRRAADFKVGDTYAFLLELFNEQATNTVYFIGAAQANQEGFPDASVKTVDLAILCVPTWKLAPGYPTNIIGRLQPRHIVAAHYDNFFQVNAKPPEVVPLADMAGFLTCAQECASYEGFEDILVPAVGSVLRFPNKPIVR